MKTPWLTLYPELNKSASQNSSIDKSKNTLPKDQESNDELISIITDFPILTPKYNARCQRTKFYPTYRCHTLN